MEHDMDMDEPNFTCTNSRILQCKRQLRLVDEALECHKEEFAKKVKVFQEREEKLREKDLLLQESIVTSHKRIQDNETKKNSEMRRIAEERRRCEEIDKEISQVQTAIDTKKAEEKSLSTLLAMNQKYKKYLENVVEEAHGLTEDLSEIQDILDRHSILKSTNNSLVCKMEQNMKDHEAGRLQYAQFMKKNGHEIRNMNNDIARLQKELEMLTITSSLDYGTYQNSNELIADIAQALLAIDNMMEKLECRAHPSLPKNPKLPNISEQQGLELKVKRASERLDLLTELINDYDSIANTWDQKIGNRE